MTNCNKNKFFPKLHNIVANYDNIIHGIVERELKDFKNDIYN